MKDEDTTTKHFNRVYNIVKKISKFLLVFIGVIILSSILIQILYIDNEDRILNDFSNNLYQYPLPPQTVIIETTKCDGKNWIDSGGSGGYWNVGATMKLSTKLKKEDILNYYKNAKFPFPKSNKLGVEPEIYFEDDLQKIDYHKSYAYKDGFYYRSKKGQIKKIHTYFDENGKIKSMDKMIENNSQDILYIIQILSGYDYFLNID